MKFFSILSVLFVLNSINGVPVNVDSKPGTSLSSAENPSTSKKSVDVFSSDDQKRLSSALNRAYEGLFFDVEYIDFTKYGVTPLGYWVVDYSLAHWLKRASDHTLHVSSYKSDNPEIEIVLTFQPADATLRYNIIDPMDSKVRRTIDALYNLENHGISPTEFWAGWKLVLNPGKELILTSSSGTSFTIVSVPNILEKFLSSQKSFQKSSEEAGVFLTGPLPSTSTGHHKYLELNYSGIRKPITVYCKHCSKTKHNHVILNNALILQLATPKSERTISVNYVPQQSMIRSLQHFTKLFKKTETLDRKIFFAIKDFGRSLQKVQFSDIKVTRSKRFETVTESFAFHDSLVTINHVFLSVDNSEAVLYGRIWKSNFKSERNNLIRINMSWRKARVPTVLRINRTFSLINGHLTSHKIEGSTAYQYAVEGLFTLSQYIL